MKARTMELRLRLSEYQSFIVQYFKFKTKMDASNICRSSLIEYIKNNLTDEELNMLNKEFEFEIKHEVIR